MIHLPFRDRREAGQLLGVQLAKLDFDSHENAIVLGLARGGVPVAAEVAGELHLPLDVVVVRKLGVPSHKELAMGAVAGGRIQVLDEELIAELGIAMGEVETIAAKEMAEAIWREHYYRADRTAPELHNWTVILVDDGLATGSSMLASVHYVNSFRPKEVIVASPVGTEEACARSKIFADACVCLAAPKEFQAVGQWYRNFDQVTHEEVRQILEQNYRHIGRRVITRRMSVTQEPDREKSIVKK